MGAGHSYAEGNLKTITMNKILYKSDSSLFFRFQHTVEILTTGKGDARSRLQEAFHQIQPIRDKDLPEKFRKEWNECRESVTRFTPRGKDFSESADMGSLAATAKRIKNKTAAKMAQLIFDIFCYLIHEENN
jgi:hypothetical protein